jgi:hypothetical protein
VAEHRADVESIEADIQRTREDLAHTIDQLTAKAKPKRSTLITVGAVAAAAIAAVVVLKRRKAHR